MSSTDTWLYGQFVSLLYCSRNPLPWQPMIPSATRHATPSLCQGTRVLDLDCSAGVLEVVLCMSEVIVVSQKRDDTTIILDLSVRDNTSDARCQGQHCTSAAKTTEVKPYGPSWVVRVRLGQFRQLSATHSVSPHCLLLRCSTSLLTCLACLNCGQAKAQAQMVWVAGYSFRGGRKYQRVSGVGQRCKFPAQSALTMCIACV